MSRVESLLTETLRDPERALPSWADPVGRVRRARALQRRRRLTAAGGAVALVAVALLALPTLRPDEPPASDPNGLAERQPVAVVTGRVSLNDFSSTTDLVHIGEMNLLAVAVDGARPRLVEIGPGLQRSPVTGTAPEGTRALLLAPGAGWALADDGLERFAPTRARKYPRIAPPGCEGRADSCPGGSWGDGTVVGGGLLLTSRHPDGSGRLSRLDPEGGEEQVSVRLPGTSGNRLAVTDGAVWVRRAGLDDAGGSWLVKFDATTLREAGRVRVPGSLTDGAIVGGGGRVWAATASTTDIYTTTGGVVPVDAETLAVGAEIATPLALEMAYADGNVWLRGAQLARIHAPTGQLRGEPVDVDGPSRGGLAVHGRYVWVAGDGVTRYDWRYADLPPEPRPTFTGSQSPAA